MVRKRHSKKLYSKPEVEKEYFEEVEVTCPKTGKKIKTKVKVVRYKSKPSFDGPSREGDLFDKLQEKNDPKDDDEKEKVD